MHYDTTIYKKRGGREAYKGSAKRRGKNIVEEVVRDPNEQDVSYVNVKKSSFKIVPQS